MNIFLKNNGSVSVFLSLLLIPVILFACIAVDAIRINGARAIATDATDLALKTAMCDYDRLLYDLYGLLAISKDEQELSYNIARYYESTINSLNLEIDENDSYTRAILQDIRNSVVKNGNIDFTNLIDMTCTDFDISYVNGSELYNPEVVKRQIVEYMKYRGVISIGDNFINKIGAFCEIPAQQKTIQKKGHYDSALCDLQDICQDIYDDIGIYCKREDNLDSYNVKNIIEDSINGTSNVSLPDVLDLIKKVNFSSSDSFIEVEGLKDINKMISGIYKNDYISCDNKVVNTDNYGYEDISEFLYDKSEEAIEYISEFENPQKCDEFVDYYLSIMTKLDDIDRIFAYNSVLGNKFDDYKEYIIKCYEDNEEQRRIKAEDNNEKYIPLPNYELNEAYEDYKMLKEYMKGVIDILNNYVEVINEKENNIKSITNKKIEVLNGYLLSKYKQIEEISNILDKIYKNLDKVKNKYIPDLQKKAAEWKDSIDELSDGDIKSNINMQYYDATKNINIENIDKLMTCVNRNLNYYNNELKLFDEVLFCNMHVCSKSIDDAFAKISNTLSTMSESDKDKIYIISDDNFDNFFIQPELLNYVVDITNLKKCNFYVFLDRHCVLSSSGSNSEAEDKAKKSKSELIDTVDGSIDNFEQLKSDCDAKNIIPNTGDIYDDFATTILNSEEHNTINSLDDIDTQANADTDSDSKKFVEKTNSDTEGLMSFIDNIGDFISSAAEDGRDNLLLAEYITEMFSCNTSNKNDNGSIEQTLAGIYLNDENNYIFGNEQEYILWGQQGDNTYKNRVYTLSVIYGMRFVLNTIYAYTDVEIKSWTMAIALALAGWTGFGVGIVQNALILILSMGETAIDLSKLVNGENVVVYKSNSSWILKPSGIGKEAISYGKSKLEDCVDKLTSKIEELSINFTDEKMDELNDLIDEYADDLANNLAASISSVIIAPIQAKLDIIVNKSIAESAEDICAELDILYKQLKADIENEEEGVSKTVKLIVLENFINEKLSSIKSEIKSLPEIVNGEISSARSKIENIIISNTNEIINNVKDELINNGYNQLKQQAKDEISKLNSNIKEKANEIIDEFTNKVSSNSYVVNVNKKDNSSNKDVRNISMITMNYKEYMKLLFISGLCAGKDEKYIARMMDIIKLNLTCSSNFGNGNFKLRNTYTLFEVNTKTKVKTTFLNYKVFDNPLKENRYYIECNKSFGY